MLIYIESYKFTVPKLKKLFLLFFLLNTAHAFELRYCYEAESLYPFTNVIGAEKDRNGVFFDILSAVTKELDIKLVGYRSSWSRCKTDLKSGKADIIAVVIWTPERDKWAVFPKTEGIVDQSKSIWEAIYRVHTKKGSDLIWSGSSFNKSNARIGAPSGYVAYAKLDQLGVLPDKNLKAAQAFKLISRERLDGYVLEEVIGQNIAINNNLVEEIQTIEKPFMTSSWFAPVSRKFYKENPELSEKIFSHLAEYRRKNQGTLLKKYLGNKAKE